MARLVTLRLLESYFRHRWLYLLPIVLLTAAAIVYYFFLAEPVYIVRGVVYVQSESLLSSLISLPSDRFGVSTPAEATADEIEELLQTDAYVRSLIQNTELEAQMAQGGEEAEELIDEVRDAVWVEAQGRNQLLVAAAYERPLVAKQLADAMVNNFIQWRINADRQETSVAQDFLQSLIATYQADLDAARAELREYLETHPEPLVGNRPATEQLEVSRLQQAIDLAHSRHASVLDKQEDAQLALAQTESSVRRTYFLIDAPAIPTAPETSLRRQVTNVIIFAVAGAAITVVAIVGAASLDRTVRFPLDVEHSVGLPVLALVPISNPHGEAEPETGPAGQARGRKSAGSEADTVRRTAPA